MPGGAGSAPPFGAAESSSLQSAGVRKPVQFPRLATTILQPGGGRRACVGFGSPGDHNPTTVRWAAWPVWNSGRLATTILQSAGSGAVRVGFEPPGEGAGPRRRLVSPDPTPRLRLFRGGTGKMPRRGASLKNGETPQRDP
jgi:hypothetical protein